MVSVRAAKSKGSQFEYDCQYSLGKIYPTIYRTAERGFQRQFDLCVDKNEDGFKNVFECKRLKGISWNQLIKFYEKLVDVTDTNCCEFLLFRSNFQPCLVFFKDFGNQYCIKTFESVFHTTFEKHPSTRVPKKLE